MNIINIKSMKKYFILMLAVVAMSCADPNLKPIVTFDDAGHGAYPRLIADSETGALLINVQSQAEFDASSYGYSVKFIDENAGNNVTAYILNVEYNSAAGISQGPVELVAYGPSDFTEFEGNAAMQNVVITSQQVTGKFGLAYADLTAGDKFKITGVMEMKDGKTHTGPTSSATVNGAAFQGKFDYIMPAACPSSIEGSYAYSTDLSGWCGGTQTGTVDIVADGGGSYSFSDWSFGGYQKCYGCCGASGSFNFVDVCQVVTLNDGVDSYGDGWTFTSVLSDPAILPQTWTITWLNFGYASGLENGVTTVTFPNGAPFVLAP
jgi:hypothetical protein